MSNRTKLGIHPIGRSYTIDQNYLKLEKQKNKGLMEIRDQMMINFLEDLKKNSYYMNALINYKFTLSYQICEIKQEFRECNLDNFLKEKSRFEFISYRLYDTNIYDLFNIIRFYDESKEQFLKRAIREIEIKEKESNSLIFKETCSFLIKIIHQVHYLYSFMTNEKEKEEKIKLERDLKLKFLMSLKDTFGRDLCSIILKY